MALTEWHDLLARLERQPDSDVIAAMLTDELMEARGMARNEADKYVATARRVAQDAADMAWLATLIKSHGPAYEALMAKINSACALWPGVAITLFVTNGTHSPTFGPPADQMQSGMVYVGIAIAIPATWARTWWEAAGRPPIKPPVPDPVRPGGQHGQQRRPRRLRK